VPDEVPEFEVVLEPVDEVPLFDVELVVDGVLEVELLVLAEELEEELDLPPLLLLIFND
jgi:hypothetical protein